MSDEHSPDGTAILRHTSDARSGAPAHEELLADAVEKHLAEHVGPAATVFHELVSDLVHIDVHVIAPTAERPTWVLYTTGMSALPMTVPPGSDADERAELVMSLPEHWLDAGSRESGAAPPPVPPERWWPIGVLKFLARLPHVYGTWLGIGHTVPNADPPEPYDPSAPFTGVVLLPPVQLVPHDWRATAEDGRKVLLLSPIFLTTAEMDFKLAHGLHALLDRLEEHGVYETLDIRRAPVVS